MSTLVGRIEGTTGAWFDPFVDPFLEAVGFRGSLDVFVGLAGGISGAGALTGDLSKSEAAWSLNGTISGVAALAADLTDSVPIWLLLHRSSLTSGGF